jgi:hypothetical protein
MRSICVFCGSSAGSNKTYREAATALGKMLTSRGMKLIYGGANVGLMKYLADSVLEEHGEVIGIMPRSLVEREVAHDGLTRLHIVESMTERKLLMVDLADAFLALPGGLGTLDELAEVMTYNQLRISDKPIGILNIEGYFDHLLDFFDHAVGEQFLREEHRHNILVDRDPERLLARMAGYVPVTIDKWIHDIRRESCE